MAPEQAKGRPADRRADIWAFGVVLSEMITGRPLFTGDSVSETLASVLKEEPKFDLMPVELRPLLRRCLQRDPRQRLQAIGEARVMLENPASAVDVPPVVKRISQRTAWIVAAVALAAALALGVMHTTETQSVQLPVRFQVPSPEESSIFSFRLSPDARYLAFIALQGGRSQIWVRPLDSLEARPFPGTGRSRRFGKPVVLVSRQRLYRIRRTRQTEKGFRCRRTASVPLRCPRYRARNLGTRGCDPCCAWSEYPDSPGTFNRRCFGPPTKPHPGENHFTPEFLPDGRHFLYSVTNGTSESNGLYIDSLDDMSPVRLLPEAALPAVYVPSAIAGRSGHLLFRRENTLMALPFDLEKLRTTGEIFPLAEPVVQFSASESGTLAYVSGVSTSRQELVWTDRTARSLERPVRRPNTTPSGCPRIRMLQLSVQPHSIESKRRSVLRMLFSQRVSRFADGHQSE